MDYITIHRGDAYPIALNLSIDGLPPDISTIDIVEVTLGDIAKTYPSNGVTFDDVNSRFLYDLTQADSFRLKPGLLEVQIRVKLKNSRVYGTCIAKIGSVERSSSEVIL